MFANKSFALMVLLVQGAPSALGFQSSSHCMNSRPYRSSASLAVSTIDQSYAENPNARRARRKTTSTSRRRRRPQGQEWINKSVEYYTTVMRKEGGSMSTSDRDEHQSRLAKRLYHAIQQVRSGNLSRAENIYRKTIQDIQDEDECSNAELATTTLLLALVLQRMGNIAEARMVFHRFFRSAVSAAEEGPFTECACTAKVLGAYALFEMRFGSVHRSMELARRAAQFDGGLSKLLDWKQFRDAKEKISGSRRMKRKHNATPCSFAGEVTLLSDAGDFRVRAYRASRGAPNEKLEFTGREPSVIYCAAKPPLGTNGKIRNDVPIRIHGASVQSAIFESERCKHKEQLELSMQYIQEHGGAIIHFEPEAQGTSIAHGVAASVLKKSGIGRRPARRSIPHRLGADVVQYSVIPSLLDDMGIESIRLVSSSPAMVRTLRELGVDVRGMVPLVVEGSVSHERFRGNGLSSALARLEGDL